MWTLLAAACGNLQKKGSIRRQASCAGCPPIWPHTSPLPVTLLPGPLLWPSALAMQAGGGLAAGVRVQRPPGNILACVFRPLQA